MLSLCPSNLLCFCSKSNEPVEHDEQCNEAQLQLDESLCCFLHFNVASFNQMPLQNTRVQNQLVPKAAKRKRRRNHLLPTASVSSAHHSTPIYYTICFILHGTSFPSCHCVLKQENSCEGAVFNLLLCYNECH